MTRFCMNSTGTYGFAERRINTTTNPDFNDTNTNEEQEIETGSPITQTTN